jgi:hypothetical protein
MPRYEVRYDENGEWIEVSDLEFMNGLYKLYRRVTPAIIEMINGKELQTPDAVYRLKWQFENPPKTKTDDYDAYNVYRKIISRARGRLT